MVKNGYYGNEGFGLPWDHIKVRQMTLFTTTEITYLFNGVLFFSKLEKKTTTNQALRACLQQKFRHWAISPL